MQYTKGQKIVVAGHGVATVTRIDSRNGRDCMILRIDSSGVVMFLPCDTKEIRPICSKDEALTCLAVVKRDSQGFKNMTWNRRYREYSESIKTGELIDCLRVFKALTDSSKELSFGERKLLEYSKELALGELNQSIGHDATEYLNRLTG